jgi:hypothetical protein
MRLESRLEVAEWEEAIDMRELAPLRRAARGTFGIAEEASNASPSTLPSSVEVRSMLMTAGFISLRRAAPEFGRLGRPREPVDIIDALLLRPLQLGSRSPRGMVAVRRSLRRPTAVVSWVRGSGTGGRAKMKAAFEQ